MLLNTRIVLLVIALLLLPAIIGAGKALLDEMNHPRQNVTGGP